MCNIIKKEGFNFGFDPKGCDSCSGNCCIGESGYIWINAQEIQSLALHLKLSVDDLKFRYLNKIGYKYSIKEIQLSSSNFACCFFNTEKRQCTVYDVRPNQCRTFPFWDYFKENEEEVYKECPAIKSL
uniref:YkgJ family cysteine cluster protein n=1 Tax=Aliarcobacter sp. TaxID=2321116 RepID=UPI004048C3C8